MPQWCSIRRFLKSKLFSLILFSEAIHWIHLSWIIPVHFRISLASLYGLQFLNERKSIFLKILFSVNLSALPSRVPSLVALRDTSICNWTIVQLIYHFQINRFSAHKLLEQIFLFFFISFAAIFGLTNCLPGSPVQLERQLQANTNGQPRRNWILFKKWSEF